MNNPYDIYKILNKSNCRQCLLPSCMAFAVALVQGGKKPKDCPYLTSESIALLNCHESPETLETDQEKILTTLKDEVAKTDLSATAARLNTQFVDDKIGISCLGKTFWIDGLGRLSSECHTNHWVYLPLLHYILHSKGKKPQDNWVNFGGLKGATKAWAQYFSHRCEDALRQLADAHPELLFEILDIFGAKKKKNITNADYCLVIEPLPNVLLMINYWPPEDDFNSQLTLLFDTSTQDNLDLDSLYLISRGLVEMFRELLVKHSKNGKLF
nr:DUF3786 domain-containing protein [Desulfobulbaceae bacterium]